VSRLFVETVGSGPDLILLHGWGLHSGVWDELVPVLAGEFRLTLVDLPGHGHSSCAAMPPSLEGVAQQLAEAVTGPAAWLGWSLGGMVALQLTGQAPGCVQRLILVAASARFTRTPDWPDAVDPAVMETFAADLEQDYQGTLRRFLALQLRGSAHARQVQRYLHQRLLSQGPPRPAALRAGLSFLRDSDLRPALARIACPVLIMVGARDPLVSPGAGLAMQRSLRGSRLVVIPGAGHAPFLSHPQVFLRELTRFLHVPTGV
jgi:pimeloyl-[acyl-carrier protein] methyl ester esterase